VSGDKESKNRGDMELKNIHADMVTKMEVEERERM
jgi:hypothetical protein